MKAFVFIFCIFAPLMASAQKIDRALEEVFDRQVKGIGEFMVRFNSDEHKKAPSLSIDSISQREIDIISVCDFDMALQCHEQNGILNQFINTVERDSIRLDFTDENWFASAECDIQYHKKNIQLNLLLTPVKISPRRYRWALADVGGKDILTIADSTRQLIVSPTDNELEFMDLAGKSRTQCQNFAGIRLSGKDIDYVSSFVALVQAGVARVNVCKQITYYFLNVPGYVFTVEYFPRETGNSGWLISSIIPIDESQKFAYLKTMFNH